MLVLQGQVEVDLSRKGEAEAQSPSFLSVGQYSLASQAGMFRSTGVLVIFFSPLKQPYVEIFISAWGARNLRRC